MEGTDQVHVLTAVPQDHRHPVDSRLGGPKSQSGQSGEKKCNAPVIINAANIDWATQLWNCNTHIRLNLKYFNNKYPSNTTLIKH